MSRLEQSGRAVHRGRSRPVDVAPGALAAIAAWTVGLAIARLTGAAAVVLLLVGAFVAIAAATVAGWWRLRRIDVAAAIGPPVAESGQVVDVAVDVIDRSSSSAAVRLSAALDRSGTTRAVTPVSHGNHVVGTIIGVETPRSGLFDTLHVVVESAGGAGLVRWRRRFAVPIEKLAVAPVAAGPLLPLTVETTVDDGATASRRGHHHGEIDGVRPWRHGESDHSIHWPSTLRANELIAHDRTTSNEARWLVSYRHDPSQLRWTLDDGLRRGVEVRLTETDGDDLDDERNDRAGTGTTLVRSREDAMRWSARRSQETDGDRPQARPTFWKRRISVSREDGTDWVVPVGARWNVAAAAAIAIAMLLGSLRAELSSIALALAGIALGTAVCVRWRASRRPLWSRIVVAGLAIAALARIAVDAAGLDGLIDALRGPMPDLLVVLVVLHGFEVADRRTARIHVAITGVLVAYAAGLRIDGVVGWWMLAWAGVAITATVQLGDRVPRATDARVPGIGALGWLALGTVTTIGVAALVPIPDGPASLGLPAVSDNDRLVDDSGALIGPSGSSDGGGSNGASSRRGALGEVGGYPGFSSTLDTSVRGDLGDEVVMRVRAPEPAFWRGQTFTRFDGRVWTVSDDRGRRIDGPEITIEPTLGDLPARGVMSEQFVQTFHIEADLPNVIFGAARPDTVIFDGAVFARPDGSIRADRSLNSGTVYTVVSDRVPVTAETLRAQGDVGERFATVTAPGALDLLAPYLAIPETTTDRTLDLARQLSVRGSTYDTVLAMQDWMAANTVYDLDAPVPVEEADAVDDHLFVSRRGFCEQIASSLVVMLRSQGVPARLATGYIPGERDRVSGVWKVRARDAHAWVEVWFPDTGWEAFDPTAEVPLAGDADRSTVGADTASAVLGGITANPAEIGLLGGGVLVAIAGLRTLRAQRRRRQRGRWGLLHDRFTGLATKIDVDLDGLLTPPVVARALEEGLGTNAETAHAVAATIDRVAFDPSWSPDDETYVWTRNEVNRLERLVGRQTRSRREPAAASN